MDHSCIPEYEQIEGCVKLDKHLGWTSYVDKVAPTTEANCKLACSNNVDCDFYAFIPTAPFLKCYCGAYKKPDVDINLATMGNPTSVTLNFKKGKF